jgi:uncharacterized SAM-binding protein YcdF (DUF218 family)
MTSPSANSSRRSPADNPSRALVWRQRFYLVVAAWLLSTLLMSFPTVRAVVAYPLYVNDEQASGEVAYVMADGEAYWERLRAASDLYHWHRIKKIAILEETRTSGYNFVRKKSDTRLERAVDYLALYGVPSESVSSVPANESAIFGSMSEAQGFAAQFPEVKQVVVVTSAPHTRRSLLCFQRSFKKKGVKIQVYSASKPEDSTELNGSLWVEYVKLAVYLFVA